MTIAIENTTRSLKEILLVSSRSSSPYSTSVVDPSNGNAIWSYKGNELNGVGSNLVEPVGVFGDYFAVLPAGRPFIYFITARKATVTTSLSGRADSVRINRTGKLAFVLVNSKVHCYNLHNGELLKISSNSLLKTSKMFLCRNDRYMAFPMEDGNLFVYTIESLLIRSSCSEEEVSPYCSYLSHSKSITDVAFSWFDSQFMLSSGADHLLVLYNLSSRTVMQKISFDTALTSCAFSLSDSMLFCGTEAGCLVKMSLFHAMKLDPATDIIQTQKAVEAETHTVLNKHEGKAICKIAMNLDGSRLSTGDVDGKVMIWDISSGQVLTRLRKDGEIHTLSFMPYSEDSSDPNYEPDSSLITKFRHELSDQLNPVIKTSSVSCDGHRSKFKHFDRPCDE